MKRKIMEVAKKTDGKEKRKMSRIILASWAVIISLLMPFGALAHEENHKSEQHHHPKYAKFKNPITMTAESIAHGKKVYEKYCIACHGEAGKGGIGPGLTGAVLKHGNTDGEIFHAISDGVAKTTMKGYKKELAEEERWHLVNYLKSLRNTEPGR